MLMKSEILNAQDKTKSGRQAASYLGVSYTTYKKWAKYYGIFESFKNQQGKGLYKRPKNRIMSDVINGKRQHPNPRNFLTQLVRESYKKDECEVCGYCKERPDGRKPLLINFLDGDRKNHKLSNIQILCYNCYYVEVGRELIGKKYNRYWTSDYFSKYEEEGYSKYNDYKFEDFDWKELERREFDEKIEKAKKEKEEKTVDSIFKEFNG